MKKGAKLLFAGDVFVPKELAGDLFDDKLKEIIKGHDMAWVNFEGPIADGNDIPIAKAGPNLKQHKDSVKKLVESGFGGFCLANNHIWDYGQSGFQKTAEQLKDQVTIGAGRDVEDAYEEKIIKFSGINIGFLALAEWGFGAAENGGGFAWINHRLVEGKIKQLRKKVDFLVLQAHAGLEEVDIPLPEWRDKYKQFIDWGADLIVGHHPHTVQPWEKYKNKYIFYSLGNCFFGKENEGLLLSVVISTKGLDSFDLVPIKSDKNGVYLDNRKVNDSNNKLDDPKYSKRINEVVGKMWQERYRGYYKSAFTKDFLGRVSTNEVMLEHNLRIESHLWTVLRYLTSKRI